MLATISVKKIKRSCVEVSSILKALSHPQRLMILGHLLSGEKTVTELVDTCEISQSQMSQFLARMKAEGLIACRRDGRYQYYMVADDRLLKLMRAIQDQYCGI
jgi:DNA-binding transcriptional ArsR family regulator